MSSGQMDIRKNIGRYKRWIFSHDAVGLIVSANPQLILLFLPPLERQLPAIEFKFKIVLVARKHLPDREAALRAIFKTEKNACQIFGMHLNRLALAAAFGGKSLCRCA